MFTYGTRYLFDKLNFSTLHFKYLHNSCSSGKVPQAGEPRATGNPFTVKHCVVQALLNMCYNLWL